MRNYEEARLKAQEELKELRSKPFQSVAMRTIVRQEWRDLLEKQRAERAKLAENQEQEREQMYRRYKGTFDDFTQDELNARIPR